MNMGTRWQHIFEARTIFCQRLPGEPRILRKKNQGIFRGIFQKKTEREKRGSSSINLRLNCIHKRKPRWEKEGVRAISRNGESPGTKMEQEKLEVGLFRENATVVRGRGRTSPSLGSKARLWELGSQQMSLKPGLFRVYNYQNISHLKKTELLKRFVNGRELHRLGQIGSGWTTAVQHMPDSQEVVGSNPSGCSAFSLLFSH